MALELHDLARLVLTLASEVPMPESTRASLQDSLTAFAPSNPAPVDPTQPVPVTTAAVAEAATTGVDPATVKGTGAGGAVTVADVNATVAGTAPAITPVAQTPVAQTPVAQTPVAPSVWAGPNTTPPATPGAGVVTFSPAGPNASDEARALAEAKGVDLASVAATGPGGQITEDDIDAFLVANPPATVPPVVSNPTPLP